MAQHSRSSGNTLYWHDYETFGQDARRDRPAQFAGIRTDEDLNIISEPLVLYCKPADDMLPAPQACLINRITPQIAREKGIPEAKFIGRINQELSVPGTCGVGYNSLRFDDEVTRNSLYRNFFDPYAREWKNGNSRWDIIDMLRLTRALRPQGITWPTHPDGKPSFRLEHLAPANGLAHESAHDALSDVRATIALAKLVRKVQPKLYDYVFQNRGKHAVSEKLDVYAKKQVLHVSRMYPAEQGCIAMVVPLANDPVDKNSIIIYDLGTDPAPLLELSAEEIRERIFTPAEKLPQGVSRVPLKKVHVNKCPVIVPQSALRGGKSELVSIDASVCEANLRIIASADRLHTKIQEVFSRKDFGENSEDPDLCIYSGGFFSNRDRKAMERLHSLEPDQLGSMSGAFQDKRLPEMLFRYRARNYPDMLSTEEKMRWEQYRRTRLTSPDGGGSITMDEYRTQLEKLRKEPGITDAATKILDALTDYGNELLPEIQA